VTLDGLSINNGISNSDGAGLYAYQSQELNLWNISFENNHAVTNLDTDIYGGAAYITHGTVNIKDNNYTNNSASSDTTTTLGGALAIKYANNASIKTSIFKKK